jgi:hypothetical protein
MATYTQNDFVDQSAVAGLLTLSICICISVGRDWVEYCSHSRTILPIWILFANLFIFTYTIIKFTDGIQDLSKLMDAMKSWMGQMINPIAMFTMYLRARVAFFDYPKLVLILQILAVIDLLGGIGIAVTREFIAWNYKKREEEAVYGNLRTNLGIILIFYSVALQILCSAVFFVYLYQNSGTKSRFKRLVLLYQAAIQSAFLLVCAILYAMYRASRANWPTTLLPVMASLTCRFIMDQIVRLRMNSSSRSNLASPTPEPVATDMLKTVPIPQNIAK